MSLTGEATLRQIDASLILDVGELGDKHAFDCLLVHVEIVSLEIEGLQREEPAVQCVWKWTYKAHKMSTQNMIALCVCGERRGSERGFDSPIKLQLLRSTACSES